MVRTTPPTLLALLWLLVALSQSAHAQLVRGRLVDAGGGNGIGGAMVSLIDQSGREIEQVLTRSPSGLFQLRAPYPGQYSVRADRIGYASTLSESFALAAMDTMTIELVAGIEPVSLRGIEAEADRRCRVRPQEGLAVARAWEEARKALEAASWTRERGLYRYEMLRIQRRLDERGRRVEQEDRSYTEVSAPAPFTSRPADSLLASGFVRLSPSGSEFWAPDADVLLSDFFLDTHCFRIGESEGGPGEPVGLEFEPAPGRQVPEIAGRMSLHPATAQLQRLDFRYVNLNVHPRLLRASPGGRVNFRTLPNGTWIVPSWHLRMFRPGETVDARTGRPAASLQAIIMEHGEVLRVHDEDDIVFEGDRGRRIQGTVFDTLQVGLPGARVFVNGEGTEVVTDAVGRFELDHLGPYTYSVYYTHPYLERLWYQPAPVEVEVGPESSDPVRVDFRTPPIGDVLDEICRGVRRPKTTGDGLLTVFVSDAQGDPVDGATVLAIAASRGAQANRAGVPRIQGQTNASGLFRMCWLPMRTRLEVVALTSDEELDRHAFEDASTLAHLFPARVREITIAADAPHRSLLLRVER